MASVEPYGGQMKRDRDLGDYQEDICPPLSKRTCTELTSPAEHVSLLEDLCELGSAPEDTLLECGAEEELVSEMMRSLEKVIAAAEEPCPSNATDSTLDRDLHRIKFHEDESASSGATDVSSLVSNGLRSEGIATCDGSESEVDIKYLFEASDDELGIPPSPESGGNIYNLLEDALCLTASSTEPADGLEAQFSIETEDEDWSGYTEWPLEMLDLLNCQSIY
eukprot:c22760_g1_i1 orf=481-1146(+)